MPPTGSFALPHATLPGPCHTLQNIRFRGNSTVFFGYFPVSSSRPIPWKSSVSEKIRVHSEGPLGYSLTGQKPVRIRGILTPMARRKSSTWEKWFVSLWHTHFQPCVSYAQTGLLIHLSLWPLTFRSDALLHTEHTHCSLGKWDRTLLPSLLSVLHILLNSGLWMIWARETSSFSLSDVRTPTEDQLPRSFWGQNIGFKWSCMVLLYPRTFCLSFLQKRIPWDLSRFFFFPFFHIKFLKWLFLSISIHFFIWVKYSP